MQLSFKEVVSNIFPFLLVKCIYKQVFYWFYGSCKPLCIRKGHVTRLLNYDQVRAQQVHINIITMQYVIWVTCPPPASTATFINKNGDSLCSEKIASRAILLRENSNFSFSRHIKVQVLAYLFRFVGSSTNILGKNVATPLNAAFDSVAIKHTVYGRT